MAVHIMLDVDYIDEFSLANTKRYIKVQEEWMQVDKDEEVVFVLEEDAYA